jgi:HSP20 family protein
MATRELSPQARRGDPLRAFRRPQFDLDRLFGGLLLSPSTEFPSVNVWTGPTGAIVTAQVPGVDPESLDIAVHQDTVTLRGNRPMEDFGENAVWHRREREHGAFVRSFILPFRVDADAVQARFEQGILILDLPQPKEDQPRRIKVARSS